MALVWNGLRYPIILRLRRVVSWSFRSLVSYGRIPIPSISSVNDRWTSSNRKISSSFHEPLMVLNLHGIFDLRSNRGLVDVQHHELITTCQASFYAADDRFSFVCSQLLKHIIFLFFKAFSCDLSSSTWIRTHIRVVHNIVGQLTVIYSNSKYF